MFSRTVLIIGIGLVLAKADSSSSSNNNINSSNATLTSEMITDFSDWYDLDYITMDCGGNRSFFQPIHDHLQKIKYVAMQSNLTQYWLTGSNDSNNNEPLYPNLHLRLNPTNLSVLSDEIRQNRGDFFLFKDTQLLQQLPLNLMSKVFSFNASFHIFELYKIADSYPMTKLYMGKWSPGTGLQISNVSMFERRSDLQGFEFRIAVLPSQPYLSLSYNNASNQYNMSGSYVDIFLLLQSILNFTYTFVQPSDGVFGSLNSDNVSWSGMIGQLTRNEIDISPTVFTVTDQRSQVVDFALPITRMHHRFFIKYPNVGFNWLAFVQPMTWQAWSIIGVMILIIPFVMWFAINELGDENERQFRLYRLLWSVSATLTFAMPWSVEPSKLVTRSIFFIIMLCGSCFFYQWQAMLISFLSVKLLVLPFTDIESLMAKTSYKIAALPGTSYVDSFRLSTDPLWLKAYTDRMLPYIQTYPTVKGQLVQKITDDDTYTLYDNYYSIITYTEYINCEIIDIPKEYEPNDFAYAFTKASPYRPMFDYYLEHLEESGSIMEIVKRYDPATPACGDGTDPEALGFGNVFTAFVILALGLCISLVLMVAEHADWKKKYLAYFHDDCDPRKVEEEEMTEQELFLLHELRDKDAMVERLQVEVAKLKLVRRRRHRTLPL